jgi:hypothetical protein
MRGIVWLLFALAACAATSVSAISLIEQSIFNAIYPGRDCDTANFTLTSGCTLTPSYWATHNAFGRTPETDIKWPGTLPKPGFENLRDCPDVFFGGVLNFSTITNYRFDESGYFLYVNNVPISAQLFFGNVAAPIDVMQSTATQNGICYVYARQYISVLLNMCNGACYGSGGINSTLFDSMQVMGPFLFGTDCQTDPTGNYDPSNDLMAAYDVLVGYNNGEQEYTSTGCELKYGPYHCENKNDNTTARPCRAVTEECLSDTCVGECTRPASYWNKNSLNAKSSDTSMTQWAAQCNLAWVDAQQGINCTGATFTSTACDATLEKTPYAPWIPALTWRGVLRTAADGDACLIAAKRIVTAELNLNCGGACSTATLEDVIAEAKAIMLAECADMVGTGLRGAGPYINGLDSSVPSNSTSGANRRRLLALAAYIANYNNGFGVGPGSCDDATIVQALEEGLEAESVTDIKDVLTKDRADAIYGMAIAILVLAAVLVLWKVVAVCCYFCCDPKKEKQRLWSKKPKNNAYKLATKFASASAAGKHSDAGNVRYRF